MARKNKAPQAVSSANQAPPPEALGDIAILRAVSQVLNSSLPQTRAGMAKALGYQYQGDRDVYTACGYSKSIAFDQYEATFLRHPVGRAIVERPVEGCWRDYPTIVEAVTEAEETVFEKACKALETQQGLNLWGKVARADLVSGIGAWGGLYLGFDDGMEPFQPVQRAKTLAYVTPLSERNIQVQEEDRDPKSPRFGKPVSYSVNFTSAQKTTSAATVHWTRVIHIAEGALENDLVGRPRLEVAFNDCDNLLKLAGCSAESFWQAAFPGLHFDIRDGATPDEQSLSDFKGQVQNYVHNLERVLRTAGVNVKTLNAQIADPTKTFEVLVSLISAGTGIPQRILMGSERGQLASGQDSTAWAERLETRRRQHIDPNIIRPLFERLISVGVLPAPPNGFTIEWPSLQSPTDKEKGEVAKLTTEALVAYSNSPTAPEVYPVDMFRRDILGMTDEQVEEARALEEAAAAEVDEETAEIEADMVDDG